MVKKKQAIITSFMLIFLLNITQVVADNGYVLIVYYEFGGETPTPGDTLTVKAELYKEANRITDSVEVEITHIGGINHLNTPISMADDGMGIFSYELTIPSTVDKNYIDLTFSAYINNKEVDSESLSIEMSDDELEEEVPSQPINSISHRVATLGETVEVLTYIPDIEYGNINSSEASVTVVFRIYGSSLESTEEKSTYIGDGFFSAVYTIPLDVEIEDTYYDTAHLSVEVHSEYSGEDFYDWFSINIAGLTVITKAAFTNNELTIDVLVLGLDYTPIKGVTLNARISLQNKTWQTEDETINLTLSNTDAYGRSTKKAEITRPDIISITGLITATKDNLYAFGSFSVFLYEDYWYDSFMVMPTEDYIIDTLRNYEKGVSLDMYVYLEGKKLANAKIDVYASWREGIIDIFTIETDNDGRLSIDIDWPTNFGALPEDMMDITIVYNNGTEWFEYEYPMTKPYDLEFNSGTKPVVNYIDYSDYQVVAVSCQLATSVKMGSIYVIPFYEEYALFYTATLTTERPFTDSSGFLSYSFIKLTDGIISSQNIIDKAFTLEYVMIAIQYPDISAKMGYKYVFWLLDPNGNPIDRSQSGIIIGFDVFSCTLLFSSMITLVIFKRRKRLDEYQ